MGQRIDVATWARLSGRSEATLRKWLAEEPPPLEVVEGPPLGQKRRDGSRGRRRWLDVDEAKRVHLERGGSAWREDWLPSTTAEALRVELDALARRLAALETGRETKRREPRETLRTIETIAPQTMETIETFPPAVPAMPTAPSALDFPPLGEVPWLPDYLVSASGYSRRHGMKQDTQWKEQAKNKTPSRRLHVEHGRWTNGKQLLIYALDSAGRREFGGFFGHLSWWVMCGESGCEACEEARWIRERQQSVMAAASTHPLER